VATVAGLEKQVAAALVRAGYSGNDTTLVVALSGGPDSSALLHCLYRLKEQHRLRLHVAHLNHNFRGEEAYEDARFAAAVAKDLGLGATVERRDVLTYQQSRRISSFEQAAREFRYAFLAEVAGAVGAAAVAVGHTSDDLAETVLLHILRGSGIHGLRGMSELSPWPWPLDEPGLRLFRPLLKAAKADTVGYCRELGQDYREDSGNLLPRFTRNRVRLNLLPLLASEYNPRIRQALQRLSDTAAMELDYLDGQVTQLWEQLVTASGGAVELHQPSLSTLHPALVNLLLRRAYAHLTGDARRLSQRNLDAMVDVALSRHTGRSLDLPGGLKLHRVYDRLRLAPEASIPSPFPEFEGVYPVAVHRPGAASTTSMAGPWQVALVALVASKFNHALPHELEGASLPSRGGATESTYQKQSWTAYLDRSSLAGPLHVRTWLPGDRFQPLGLAGEKKLQDFFTDARVPRTWRGSVPLLVAPQGIAWVVGYRIAHWARVLETGEGASEALVVTFARNA